MKTENYLPDVRETLFATAIILIVMLVIALASCSKETIQPAKPSFPIVTEFNFSMNCTVTHSGVSQLTVNNYTFSERINQSDYSYSKIPTLWADLYNPSGQAYIQYSGDSIRVNGYSLKPKLFLSVKNGNPAVFSGIVSTTGKDEIDISKDITLDKINSETYRISVDKTDGPTRIKVNFNIN